MKFDFYSDPYHGWLKVPRKLLHELDIASIISPRSRQRGDFVYLDRKNDHSKFMWAWENRTGKLLWEHVETHDSQRVCRVNSYPAYVYQPSSSLAPVIYHDYSNGQGAWTEGVPFQRFEVSG